MKSTAPDKIPSNRDDISFEKDFSKDIGDDSQKTALFAGHTFFFKK